MERVTVRLFGSEAALAGTDAIDLTFDDAPTCDELREALVRAQPELTALASHWRIAVNASLGPPDQRIRATDEVAVIGLVSGG